MASETQAQAISETLHWLEQQIREGREEHGKSITEIDQLRRQVFDLSADLMKAEQALREVDPKFVPFRGIPEKIRTLDGSTEHIRQQVLANKTEIDNALRLIRAEAQNDRGERSEAFKRIEAATGQVSRLLADLSQVQAQASQVSQVTASMIERQREVEARVEQYGLRLDRTIEVNHDLEERVKEVVTADLEDRFEVVFERLQLVGEMVKRNELLITAATAEQTLREEVLDALGIVRDQQGRVEARLGTLEEVSDRALTEIDKLRGEIALVEGRHAGLGERVASMRRDIAEVVDHVREEFAKYNQLTEKQRRKQIQILEQELREMKFHSFRPPEEP